ncbi:exoribonuclease RNase R [Prevotella intermedia]|uniref:Ribonuclease R n=1 Tax=Prevotella intermedia TaxID=28131 RepID=A0AAD1BFW9_PREIN|nr:ribonuclease R [Prevotella intermedia]AFJ08832.1 ribonuclease R [Prevotella intermedia 17]APW33616.1 ribonuclease R [Prevotella intermedia]BAR94914.1 exoribonuclease RNase R [Prevotella intermedia]
MGKEKKSKRRLTKAELAEQIKGFFQTQPDETFSLKHIFKALKLTTHPLKMLAIDVMEEMAWDDYLSKVGENAYTLNTKGQVQEGVFLRKSNGKNSFLPDDGGTPVFISERNSMSALNGDRVKVQFFARRRNHIKEAMVIEILQRKKETFVGRLQVEPEIAFLITQENLFVHDILIPKKALNGGKTDDRAVVRITKWPDANHKNLVGEVVDILGQAGDNDVEMNTILAQYGLPYKYPKAVEEAAEKISAEITPQDIAEREDFRNIWTCTIDPEDAKDFDDALSIRKLESGLWEVGVHIADVSHYVKEGDIIDREAQKRATSIYLVDRTIPMLPERLCNLICSLRPNEDKLAYSAIFQLNDNAEVKHFHLAHTIIKSDRRYAYEEVQQLLEDNGVVDGTGEPAPTPGKEGYKGEYAEKLIMLDCLAKKLRAERIKKGSVKFDSEELHFDIDEHGKPTRCYFKRSKDANKLIEEFMLLANKYVAQHVGKVVRGKKAKTLPYRVHDNPDPQKFENLRQFSAKFGYKLKSSGTKGATARALNALMDEVAGKSEQKVIQTVALRSMMKAKYTTHNIGHFGLAFDYYTHFTSPIRRYPDTMVHRLLTRYEQGGHSANQDYIEELCEHSSDMEQVAQNAERDSIKYKMVEFMGDHLGECYDAHISGIQSYGIYAEIDENHCEGMIPMRDLDDDYYEFDEKNYCLVGRRRHHKYQLGDPIRIQVANANLERKQLDFTLADDQEDKIPTRAPLNIKSGRPTKARRRRR